MTSWPAGSVTGLIGGALLTPKTSAVLRARLDPFATSAAPVLDPRQLTVLTALAERLIPQNRSPAIDVAGTFNRRLADGVGDGWRYADLPPDAEAVALGLDALDAAGFTTIDAAAQDAMIGQIQAGRTVAGEWARIPSARWFEEVLASLVDIYYSHPFAQEEIGYAGMADARGWQDVGFGARAPHEPEPIGDVT